MHERGVERPRYDLHRVFMRPVAPDIGNVATAVHQHGVPREQDLIVERRGMVAIDVGHEFGRPGFRRAGAALIGGEAQVLCQRRLDAGAVEDFALDGGAVDYLLRYEFDGQTVALVGVEVMERTDDDTGAFQKSLLGRAKAIRVEAKIRPVRMLPVPAHDR